VTEGHDIIRRQTSSVEETQRLGFVLGELLPPGSVVLLTGDLGAGKTQFTKGIARALQVDDEITSPTFNILLVHDAARGQLPPAAGAGAVAQLQHFDLYRLEDEAELDDIDYFGMLERDDAVSVVEWGDKFPQALPADYLSVQMQAQPGGTARGLQIWAHGNNSVKILSNLIESLGEQVAGLEA
jgi:tRNA threonylcarbamoyladenosine biosynthesis protein TsaE